MATKYNISDISQYQILMKRLAAILLDIGVFFPISVLSILFYKLNSSPIIIQSWDLLHSVLALSFHIFFVFVYGQTPGKMAMGIIILDQKGSAVSLQNAMLRSIFYIAGLVISLLMLYLAIFDPKQLQYLTANSQNIFAANLNENHSAILLISLFLTISIFSIIDIVILLFHEKKRSLRDIFAGTIVVKQHPEDIITYQKELQYILSAFLFFTLLITIK